MVYISFIPEIWLISEILLDIMIWYGMIWIFNRSVNIFFMERRGMPVGKRKRELILSIEV